MADSLRIVLTHGGIFPYFILLAFLPACGVGLMGLVFNKWHLGLMGVASGLLLVSFGVLGTASGMIKTFSAMASASPEQKAGIAAIGASEALLVFQFGLAFGAVVVATGMLGMLRGPRLETGPSPDPSPQGAA